MAATRRTMNADRSSTSRGGAFPPSTQFGRHQRDPDSLVDDDDDDHHNQRIFARPSTAQPVRSTPASFGVSFPHHQHLTSRFCRAADDDDAEHHKYEDEDDVWAGAPAPYLISSSRSSCGKRTPDCGKQQHCSGRRSSASGISRYPGPGSYDTSLKPGGPSFSMGSRESLRRTVGPGEFSPGPGAYNVKMHSSGPSFSMGPRFRVPTSQQDMNPGPGSYSDLPGAFGQGLSFTMREKLK